MSSLPWDEFRLVRAIAEHRSLGSAAQALGINNSTVFRRLNALEEMLGVRMFERARSGYLLTSAGEEMVALAARMQDSILDFERRIAGQDVRPSGELRVTTTDTMFSHLVAPMFGTFHQKYPEITLDFIIDNRILNLSRRDADVAIRATAEPPETLVGRRVASLGWASYASVAFMEEQAARSADEHDTSKMRWIGYGEPMALTAGGRWLNTHVSPDCIVAKVNNMSSLASAVSAGLGIGLMPCFMGEHLPCVQRLERITLGADSGLWLLTHPDLKKAARVRAFLDFFGNELTKSRKLIEGEL